MQQPITAQKPELKIMVESVKEILEKNFTKKLLELGIRTDSDDLSPLEQLVDYNLLTSASEKQTFQLLREEIHSAIKQESALLETWEEGFTWYCKD